GNPPLKFHPCLSSRTRLASCQGADPDHMEAVTERQTPSFDREDPPFPLLSPSEAQIKLLSHSMSASEAHEIASYYEGRGNHFIYAHIGSASAWLAMDPDCHEAPRKAALGALCVAMEYGCRPCRYAGLPKSEMRKIAQTVASLDDKEHF